MRYRPLLACLFALMLGFVTACSEAPPAQQGPLTYDQIHGTGLAAICPEVKTTTRGKIEVPAGKGLKLDDVCLQPVSIDVEEEKRTGEKQFVSTKRFIIPGATLGPIQAEVRSEGGGLAFDVLDGMTFQATTVELPGRERVPLLFSAIDFKGKATSAGAIDSSTDFEGKFSVPGYRGSTFLDPRGRGTETGYEAVVGLQAAQEDYPEGSLKVDELTEGDMSIQIARVDPATGEIGGSFVSYQMSSDEQKTLEPHLVRIQGIFYGRVADDA